MDENMSISNAEMKVMNHIWKTGAMITVPEMLAILNEEGEECFSKRELHRNGATCATSGKKGKVILCRDSCMYRK